MKSLCGKSVAPANWKGDYVCCNEAKLIQEARESWHKVYGQE